MSGTPDLPSGYDRDPRRAGASTAYDPYAGSNSEGLTALAGWLLILGGCWSFFAGLAVAVRKSYFTALPGYLTTSHYHAYHWNLSGWGWANLILGIVVVAAGVCVLLGQTWARWAGVVVAVISGLGSFLFLPFYPFWPILVIAVDVFIIWALVTARRRQDICLPTSPRCCDEPAHLPTAALRGTGRGLAGCDPQPARLFATCTSLTRGEQDQDA